jgi:hypothetical protein
VGTDGHAFAQLELSDGLAGLGDLRLLPGDGGEVAESAPSINFESRAASPTPMLTTTLVTPGTCMTFARANSSRSAGTISSR